MRQDYFSWKKAFFIFLRQHCRLSICFVLLDFDKYWNQKQELKELWLWDELACLIFLCSIYIIILDYFHYYLISQYLVFRQKDRKAERKRDRKKEARIEFNIVMSVSHSWDVFFLVDMKIEVVHQSNFYFPAWFANPWNSQF